MKDKIIKVCILIKKAAIFANFALITIIYIIRFILDLDKNKANHFLSIFDLTKKRQKISYFSSLFTDQYKL